VRRSSMPPPAASTRASVSNEGVSLTP
jgi:hypothetical protein